MIRSLAHRCRQQILGTTGTCLSANEAPGLCSVCGGDQWYVQKTRPRHGRTLTHGQFDARETVRVCASGCRHGRDPDFRIMHRPLGPINLLDFSIGSIALPSSSSEEGE